MFSLCRIPLGTALKFQILSFPSSVVVAMWWSTSTTNTHDALRVSICSLSYRFILLVAIMLKKRSDIGSFSFETGGVFAKGCWTIGTCGGACMSRSLRSLRMCRNFCSFPSISLNLKYGIESYPIFSISYGTMGWNEVSIGTSRTK